MYASYKAVLIGHKLAYFSPFINQFFSSFSLTIEKHFFFASSLSEIFPFGLLQRHLKVGLKTNDSNDVEQNLHHLLTAHA